MGALRDGRFEQGAVLGTIAETSSGWRAVVGDGRAEADSLIGAVVAATRVVSELALTDVWLSELECEVNSSIGVPFVAADRWVYNGSMLPGDPQGVEDLPGYLEVARILGPPPGFDEYSDEEIELDEAEYEAFYDVASLGHLYFVYDYGPCQWTFLGWYDDAADAAEATASSGDGLIIEMFV